MRETDEIERGAPSDTSPRAKNPKTLMPPGNIATAHDRPIRGQLTFVPVMERLYRFSLDQLDDCVRRVAPGLNRRRRDAGHGLAVLATNVAASPMMKTFGMPTGLSAASPRPGHGDRRPLRVGGESGVATTPAVHRTIAAVMCSRAHDHARVVHQPHRSSDAHLDAEAVQLLDRLACSLGG